MTIYPDSSFLISFLYPGDSNHAKARAYFRAHASDEWTTSIWSEYETLNGLRSLCLVSQGPSPATVEAIRRLFMRWHRDGPFGLERVEWDEIMRDAGQISAALAARMKARAADILHIAILEQIIPDEFVTFDHDQAALASQRGFNAVHLS